MNDHDKANLKFIMSIHGESLTNFVLQSTPDDINYALEIIHAAVGELIEKTLDHSADDDHQFPDAYKVLQKFRLTK
jgi:hypothetical protein